MATKSTVKGKFMQYMAGTTASLTLLSAGMVYGWINPINDHLLSDESPCAMTPAQSSWVATLPELGTLFTCIPGGFLVDIIGRKAILLCATPMTIVGWTIVYFTNNVYVLMVARTLQGMAVGFTSTAFPMYLSEIAEPSIRGTMGNFFMLAFTLGQLTVYAIGPHVSYWTLAGLCSVPSWLLLFTFTWFYESPYYLLMIGKVEKANKSLKSFRGIEVDEEIVRIKLYMDEERMRKDTWKVAITTEVGRKAMFIISIIATTVFMGGYNVLIMYSSSIFNKTFKNNEMSPYILTILMGVLLCFTAVLGSILLDVWGRRPSLLLSHWGNTASLSVAAAYYTFRKSGYEIEKWALVPVVFVIISALLSLIGICAIKVYQTELFPTASRGFATGVNTFICGLVSSFTVLMFVPLDEVDLVYVTFIIFASCSLIGAIFIFFMAPETKGKTFEEIQEHLATTNREH